MVLSFGGAAQMAPPFEGLSKAGVVND